MAGSALNCPASAKGKGNENLVAPIVTEGLHRPITDSCGRITNRIRRGTRLKFDSSLLRPKEFSLHSIGVIGITANFVRYDGRAGLALSEKQDDLVPLG